ncbi:hypothetical protein F0562_002622 [Nyssa sinensis]|uniref:Uncharacterized protein n=1 Tax=Nyssa sinensis TaxID=561372 RepID=A0A5J5C6G9_9ASTE|nr:hypothetical protein F0562_002622 [Nyssa sinensis]
MDSRKSIRSLAESIHSLLGLKTHLTCSWADSVCNIIKSLPSEEQPDDQKNDKEDVDIDLGTTISNIKDELAALNANIYQLNIQRRQVLNDFLDMKG